MTASNSASPLAGALALPGDKSISHRALMLASQRIGACEIHNLLEGHDVLATAAALRAMGVRIEKRAQAWHVQGVGVGGLMAPETVLDMGNSGTSTRLLMGLVAPYPFTSFFSGDSSLSKRPMQRVIEPLAQMGVRITASEGGRLPLAVHGNPMAMPITYTLPVASAQVKSCVLLAGLNLRGETQVVEHAPTRDHTERMLAHFGWQLRREEAEGGTLIALQGQQEVPHGDISLDVPSDPSSAAFFLVAASIVEGSRLILPNVCVNPTRTGIIASLQEMGARIALRNQRIVAGEPVADIEVEAARLRSADIPADRAPSMIDEYPILAVAAAYAEGTSRFRGLHELRVKESDRLAAIAAGLEANGVACAIEGDDLIVHGGAGHVEGGGLVKTHMDHRIAMSFLILGLASAAPVRVDSTEMIATSFPGFFEAFATCGHRFQPPAERPARPFVVAIDGPAASGKGTLARRIAEHYGLAYLDTGSLYRAVGLKLVYNQQDPSDLQAAIRAARDLQPHDLSNPRLRQEKVGQAASIVSAMPEVRAELLEYQRRYALSGTGAVLDGRDIGTVVCPEADVKLFITADMETRADRRYRELKGEGLEITLDSILRDLQIRDERDQARAAAPLKPAEDAEIVDTSGLDAEAVYRHACDIIDGKLKAASAPQETRKSA